MKKNHSTISIRTVVSEYELEKKRYNARYKLLRDISVKSPFCPFIDFFEGDRDISYVVIASSVKSLRDEIHYCALKKKRVNKKRIWSIMLDILICLSSVHQNNLYLGILCPQLIKLNRMGNGRIKVDNSYLLESCNQKYLLEGLPPYLAPEQYAMSKFSSRLRAERGLNGSCDIWSLGVILLEYMLTNKLPYSVNTSKVIPQKIYLNLMKFLMFAQSMAPWITESKEKSEMKSQVHQQMVNEAIKKKGTYPKTLQRPSPLSKKNSNLTFSILPQRKKKDGGNRKLVWDGLTQKDTRSSGTDIRVFRRAIRRLQKIDKFLISLVFRMCCFDPSERPSLRTIVNEIVQKYLEDVKKNKMEQSEKPSEKITESKKRRASDGEEPSEINISLTMFRSKIDRLSSFYPNEFPELAEIHRKRNISQEDFDEREVEVEHFGEEEEADEELYRAKTIFDIPLGDCDAQLEEFYLKWKMYYEKKKILKYLEQRRELFTDPLIFRTNAMTNILQNRVLPSPPTSPAPPGFQGNGPNGKSRFHLNQSSSSQSGFVEEEEVITLEEYGKKQLRLPYSFFYNWHSRKFDDYAISIAVPKMLKHVNGLFNYGVHAPNLFNTILRDETDNDEEYQLGLVSQLRPLLAGWPGTKKSLQDFLVRERCIPPVLRAEVWRCLLVGEKRLKSLKESFQKIPFDFKTLYDKQIKVDIVRCHQYHLFLKSAQGKAKLLRILKSFCVHNQYCYVQGLDSVCAPFLCLYPESPETAYFCFRSFVENYLQGYFLHENFTEEIDRNLRVFEHLLQENELVVYQKLRSMNLQLQSFSLAWMLTLFSHSLTIESIFKLWDFVFIQSIEEERRAAGGEWGDVGGTRASPSQQKKTESGKSSRKEMICMYIAVCYLKLMKKKIMTSSFSEVIKIFKDLNTFDVNVVIQMTRDLMNSTTITDDN